MLSPDIVALVRDGNFAMLTTLRPDGHPASQVMWVDCDDECLLINTEKHRRKYRNAKTDPRVTVTVWERDNPYKYVEIRGIVEEFVEGQAAREHIDHLARRYFDRPYRDGDIESERVILRIRPLESARTAS